MKLKSFYQEVVKKGIEADVRSKKEIEDLLKKKKKEYEGLDKDKKELFDLDSLFNPFADTRILHDGDPSQNIKSVIVGIDVDGAELLLVDRLKEKNISIDLLMAHHPSGHAYAHFYEVMDHGVQFQQGYNFKVLGMLEILLKVELVMVVTLI